MKSNQRLQHALDCATIIFPKASSIVCNWQSTPCPEESGVYAFTIDDEIVYIGRSVNLKRRTSQHIYKKLKCLHMTVDHRALEWYESVLIERYRPRLNVNHHHFHINS